MLFGEGAPFVTALENLARRSPVLPALGGGGTKFQPLWVEDLVTCIQQSCTRDELLGREHALGGAEILTFREILRVISRRLGKRRLIVPIPLALARLPNPALPSAAVELFSFDNATDLDSVERMVAEIAPRLAGHGSQSRNSSLIDVFARVLASTRLTITAQ